VLFAMTGVLAFSISLLVLLSYLVTASAGRASLDAVLVQEVDAFSAAIKSAPKGDGLADATRAYLTSRGSSTAGLDPILLVRLTPGRVISNSDVRLESAAGNSAPNARRGPRFSTVTYGGVSYRMLTVPVNSQGQHVGVFQAALADATARQTATRVALTLAAAGLIGIALGLPLSFFASRRALAPLARMAADAQAISHATEPHITYDGPNDELGSLADALNDMLRRLQAAYDDQRRFVADASHELRTPVAVIRGNTELLASGRISGHDADESLNMIEHEAIRMSRLLDDLLALARLESSGKSLFQPLMAQTLIDEAAARGRALGARRIEVSHGCAGWIQGDPDLLDQALANLVKNAVAHTAEGGHIVLTCTADERIVSISVTDDGPGIPEADLPRVFDRFYRSPGRQRPTDEGGAGLGLAITSRLVQLHGGRINATNVEPHGARFTIELARIPAPIDFGI
jgi:signal transduction histidine kinase